MLDRFPIPLGALATHANTSAAVAAAHRRPGRFLKEDIIPSPDLCITGKAPDQVFLSLTAGLFGDGVPGRWRAAGPPGDLFAGT